MPLNDGGFANVSITLSSSGSSGQILVAQGSSLKVQPGGSITFKGAGGDPINVLGDLAAVAGTISITTGSGDITVGPDAVISAAGEWINNSGQPGAPNSTTYVNGGSITLSTGENSTGGNQVAGDDTSGSILLNSGSVLNVSSGGLLLLDGELQTSNGIPVGKGGSISLLTYANNATGPFGDIGGGGHELPAAQPTTGRIAMDGTLEGWGFSGGGTLALEALGFQIGGDPSQAPAWDLYLPANFFAQQGFGKYQLNAMYDITVAPDVTVGADAAQFHGEPRGAGQSAERR